MALAAPARAVVLAALLALVLALAAHAGRRRPGGLWAAAWAAILASGCALVFAPGAAGAAVADFLSPVFPGAQLAGALALTRGRAPAWVAPAALGLAVLRVALPGLGPVGPGLWLGMGLEPLGTLAAAGVLGVAARRDRTPRSLALAVPLLVAAAGVDGASAWLRSIGSVPAWLGASWAVLAAVGVPLQLHAAMHRHVRQQDRLRRHTEAELRDTRERFVELSESSFDLVAELDGDEHFTYVNPRYEEVLGHPRDTFLGMRPADFVHPDDLEGAARFAEEAARTGRASGLVLRARRRDGSWIWLESAARSFRNARGERRWVLSSRDVTDRRVLEEMRRRSEAELRETVSRRTAALHVSESRFRALADHAPELISEFDERGRYTFANAAFRELLGREPDALLGTSPEALLHPDDLAASREGMARALREEGAAHAVHRLRRADGSWRWFENTGRAYRTPEGALRFVSMGRDVTEARRAEAEQQRLRSHLEEVQRLESLGVLAGGIAHDFNNLLAVISGNVALLETDGTRTAEARTRLRRIRAAARHAEELTAQMLAYAGKSVSERVPVDLSAVVRDTEELLWAAVGGKCRLVFELAPGLPALRGDPTQLRQVLLNLVTNASEAMGDDGGTVRVRTGTRPARPEDLEDAFGAPGNPPDPDGSWVMLEVADDGPGMDPAVRQRIFEPFYSTKRAGRGLGLAAVLGIVRAHGGALKLEAGTGWATCFRMLLPPSDPACAAASPAPPPRPPPGRPAGRVLVVDDDDAVREVAEAFLQRGGLAVETATGGHAALARLREGAPVDAVLLDLAMPDLSGAELLQVLRAEWPGLPVVVSSGYKHDLAAERLGDDQAFAFVQKPYDPKALVATLRAALQAGRAATA